jgi:imidazolonepropionase-like amidohydrolase
MRARAVLLFLLSLSIVLLAAATPQTAAQSSQPGASGVMAIKAGKLVDPEKGTTAANQIILIRGRKIEAIGTNVQIPAEAQIIDLSRSTVMPGLFDAHTHLCMTVKKDRDAGNYYITTLLDSTPYRAIEGVANARDMLAAGFTTIRDVGNSGNYADTALREAIERGVVPGPTMANAGRIIAPYG